MITDFFKPIKPSAKHPEAKEAKSVQIKKAKIEQDRQPMLTTLLKKINRLSSESFDSSLNPDLNLESKPDLNLEANSNINFDLKSDLKSDSKSNLKSDLKSDLKSNSKSNLKSNLKSNSKFDLKSNSNSDSKSNSKFDLKSNSKSDLNSDSKSDFNSDSPENSDDFNEIEEEEEKEILEEATKLGLRSREFDALSGYEKLRAINVMKNQMMLASLGVQKIEMSPKREKKTNSRRISTPKVKVVKKYNLRGSFSSKEPEICEPVIQPKQEEPEKTFDDSSVLRYALNLEEENENGILEGPLDSFVRTLISFQSPNPLNKVYSMSFGSELLAAGGAGGYVAVFPLRTESTSSEEPLLHWKAHKGWVSGVQFLSEQMDSSKKLLMTSSNDKTITLWDIFKQDDLAGSAFPIFSDSDHHSAGIWSFHEIGLKMISSSKSGLISYFSLNDRGMDLISCFNFHNNNIVKSVRLCPTQPEIFASGGNDAVVHVGDVRLQDPVVNLEGMHSHAINTVRWHPIDPNLLLSSAFDPHINLYDIRKPQAPLFSFVGHHGASNLNKITHPAFVDQGTRIVSSGQKSTLLSLYDTQTGKTVSRGDIQCELTSLEPHSSKPLLAAAHSGQIFILKGISK